VKILPWVNTITFLFLVWGHVFFFFGYIALKIWTILIMTWSHFYGHAYLFSLIVLELMSHKQHHWVMVCLNNMKILSLLNFWAIFGTKYPIRQHSMHDNENLKL
jgi:hypothetical protein